jgi:hypothetical protein
VADPFLNELLRRAVFGQAVQGLNTGFAPVPITFGPTGGTPQAGVRGQMGGGGAQEIMADGSDFGAPGGFTGDGVNFNNEALAQTPFGPITPADIRGFFANLATPVAINLASKLATGRTVGTALKASLTPVSEASIAMSPQAFDMAQQIGITPAEAQGLINAMGGSEAVAGRDPGTVAAQALGFDIGMGTSYGAVGGDGGMSGGGSADSGAATGGGVM